MYSATSAAYMSDPRLCHTTLRLGAATPDNKHGKQDDKMTGDNVDKLIPVKEEDHDVSGGHVAEYVLGGGRVAAVTWCDNVVQTDLGSADSLPVSQLYMCADSAVNTPAGGQSADLSPSPPVTALRLAAGSETDSHENVSSTCCSVFSLSECVVSGSVGVGQAHSLPVPVSEVRLMVAPVTTPALNPALLSYFLQD